MDVHTLELASSAADRTASLRAAFDAEYPALLRLAILAADSTPAAEDAVQEAFLRLHDAWHTIDDPARVGAWLRSTMLNHLRAGWRRGRRDGRFVALVDVDGAGADTVALLADEHREVCAALRTLAPRQRQVLVLRYWTELDEAEIAQTLGISRGSVKTHASRGLRALRARLEMRDDD